MAEPTIADFYTEDRTFPPPSGFASSALVTDDGCEVLTEFPYALEL